MKTSIVLKSLCALFATVLMVSAQPADIRQGLVSYWPLDGNDAGTTPDLAFGNTMTVNGSLAVNPGQVGNAFTFDGSSTYLSNIHSPDNYPAGGLPIYRAGSYTITMWVKGPAQTGRYLFTEGNNSGANQAVLLILQTGQAAANNAKFDVIIRTDGNTPLVDHRVSTNVVFDNTWHHIGWVDDRGSARLYVDGNLDPANFNYTPAGTFTFTTTIIGALSRAAVSGFFNGQIDDVAVWERPLSQAEIQQVRSSSLQTPIPQLPPYILADPVGGTRGLGDRFTFAARVVGQRPLSYQWYKDGTELFGATTNPFTAYNLTVADSGGYNVIASNPSGSVTSLVATLTVVPDPAPDVRRGLISYWPMNDIIDDMGQLSTPDLYSHNDFRLLPSGIYDKITSDFGNGILFNGTSQYGVRSGGFPIYNNPAFSVALWVNANGTGQSAARFFSESATNNNNPLFTFGSDATGANGTVRVFISNDSNGTLLNRNSTRTALDGTWHHVVWTETNGQGKLYIDGALDESDFAYTRGLVTLSQTTVGSILRNTNSNFFAGGLDEVAVWTRVLNFTEIQEIRTNGIPPPIMAIPPMITQHPASQSVFTGAKVNFSFSAIGTSPLDAQWRKGGTGLVNETNSTLMLTNVILSDAGDYTVVVTNSAGSATSEVATLTVTLRPPPPTEFQVDFNHTNAPPAETEAGFSAFSLPEYGLGPFRSSFGGADVTLSGVGVVLQSRRRATPIANGAFTQEQLLRDFVFALDSTTDTGMDIAVEFLEPGTSYEVTLWSFDTGSTGSRISNWSANGTPVRTAYTFDGNVVPSDNSTYRFSFNVTSDLDGKFLIQGRRAVGGGIFNVFLNALKVSKRHLRVTRIEFPTPFDITLTIDALDPNAPHHIQQKVNVDDTWADMPDNEVTFSPPNGSVIQATFAAPITDTRFYRVVQDP